jgi:hypothetical protein
MMGITNFGEQLRMAATILPAPQNTRFMGESFDLVQFDFLCEELSVVFVASCLTEYSIFESAFHWSKRHVCVAFGLEKKRFLKMDY